MKITCISDLHGHYPQLDGGDLLIVAGDLTSSDKEHQYEDFGYWFNKQTENYDLCVVVAGNHDNRIEKRLKINEWVTNYGICYLEDSGIEFKGLKIWGSPWTTKFKGMNPHCMAFTVDTDEELSEKWAFIPHDTNILITHSPREDCLDRTIDGRTVGSRSLVDTIVRCKNLKLHVCGHIHEGYGQDEFGGIKFINASHVNERYQPVNKPIRVII